MQQPALIPCILLAACAAAPSVAPVPAAVELTGTVAYEAHLARPHATRDLTATVRVFRAGALARVELREAATGQANPELTTYLRDADGACWVRSASSTQFRREAAATERFLHVLLDAAADAALGEHRVAFQHARLGDVADHANWTSGSEGPELRVRWHRTADQVEFVLRHTAATPAFDAATAFALGDVDATPPAATRTPAPARFRTLAPGVHEITLPTADSRSLAIEFLDHLVLCETSFDNPAGEQLLAALDEHLPGKPVRYVLFGHYHPHYTGGLRPVMARGAVVVAPPLGAAFAAEIAARPFRNPPDVLAASGRQPAVETFRGERTFRDDSNELVAIDIGKDSHHTDEYVVFWLPRQGILFEGDLGWFAGPNSLRGGGARARGLLQAIDERKLPVTTLVQSWPTVGMSTLPMAEFRALLAK